MHHCSWGCSRILSWALLCPPQAFSHVAGTSAPTAAEMPWRTAPPQQCHIPEWLTKAMFTTLRAEPGPIHRMRSCPLAQGRKRITTTQSKSPQKKGPLSTEEPTRSPSHGPWHRRAYPWLSLQLEVNRAQLLTLQAVWESWLLISFEK